MKYNYYDAVKEDLKTMIGDNADYYGWNDLIKKGCLSDAQESIYDHAFIDDAVTGNASGSYTFNTYDAEENLCHNMDLLKEACEEFGTIPDLEDPEACDVTIRCYILSQVLYDVIEDLEDDA